MNQNIFSIKCEFPKAPKIVNWLRKEREFSFYGDIDFIPTEQYTIEDATFLVKLAQSVVNE